MKRETMLKEIDAIPCPKNSQWRRGVKQYAHEIVEDIECEDLPDNIADLKALCLNGARDWQEYSYGGCALIYNGDICERLCTPRAAALCKYGELAPRDGSEWIDKQTQALAAAWRWIREIAIRHITEIRH